MNKAKPKKNKQTSKIWGGRFQKDSSEIMKTINASIWFDKKLDALMTGVVKRCDIEVLKKQEKKIKKMPDSVLNQLNNINQQIENMNKRMVKIEEERNLEKELWHKIRANPPRKH